MQKHYPDNKQCKIREGYIGQIAASFT